MRKTILLAICALALFACKKNHVESDKVYVVTGEADAVTSTSANITFFIYPDSSMKNIEKGVMASTDPEFTIISVDGSIGYTNDTPEYMLYMNMLEPSTKYYYRAYLYCEKDGKSLKYFGEVKTVTTLPEV